MKKFFLGILLIYELHICAMNPSSSAASTICSVGAMHTVSAHVTTNALVPKRKQKTKQHAEDLMILKSWYSSSEDDNDESSDEE